MEMFIIWLRRSLKRYEKANIARIDFLSRTVKPEGLNVLNPNEAKRLGVKECHSPSRGLRRSSTHYLG